MSAGVKCPYCGKSAQLMDSARVYGGKSYGMIWACLPCDAWVGVHKDSNKNIPLGRLANAELREWKKAAHRWFDPLWQRKMQKEGIRKMVARGKAYKWLAKEMGIERADCHIGMFDVEQCKKVVELCRPYHPKPMQSIAN